MALRLKKLPGNKKCADCGKQNPDWASLNIGVLMCLDCSGCHRNLGVHISKVRSLTMDKWSTAMVNNFKKIGGNTKVNSIYEAQLGNYVKPTESSDRDERYEYIREKYDEKKWHVDSSKPEQKLSRPKSGGLGKPQGGEDLYPNMQKAKSGRARLDNSTYSRNSNPDELKQQKSLWGMMKPKINILPNKTKTKPKAKTKKNRKGLSESLRHDDDDDDMDHMYMGPGGFSHEGNDEFLLENSQTDRLQSEDFGDLVVGEAKSPDKSQSPSIVPMREGPPIKPKAKLGKPSNAGPRGYNSPSRQDLFKLGEMMKSTEISDQGRAAVIRQVKEGKTTMKKAIEAVRALSKQKSKTPPASKSPQGVKNVKTPKKSFDPTLSQHFAGFDKAFDEPLLPGSRPKPKPKANNSSTSNANPSASQPISPLKFEYKTVEFFPGQLGLMTSGQTITRVTPGSQAAVKGVQIGWFLVKVSGVDVRSSEEVVRELKKHLATGRPFSLTFRFESSVGPAAVPEVKSAPSEPEEEHSSEDEGGADKNDLSMVNGRDQDEKEDDMEENEPVPYQNTLQDIPSPMLDTKGRTPFDDFQPVPLEVQPMPVNAIPGPGIRPPMPPGPASGPSGGSAVSGGEQGWKNKLEKVTTQTIQAVMVLRKDSLAANSRLATIEAKIQSGAVGGGGQADSVNIQKMQAAMVSLKRHNEMLEQKLRAMHQDIAQERKNNMAKFSKLMSMILALKSTVDSKMLSPSPAPSAAVPNPMPPSGPPGGPMPQVDIPSSRSIANPFLSTTPTISSAQDPFSSEPSGESKEIW
ncbi:hypothetical protein AAMO2058_000291500 [Amorphochlora amoebiformis]